MKACTMVPPEHSCVFFHSDPAVDPCYITITNLSLEYNYMLSPNVVWSEGHPAHVMGDTGSEYTNSCALLTHTQLLPVFAELKDTEDPQKGNFITGVP